MLRSHWVIGGVVAAVLGVATFVGCGDSGTGGAGGTSSGGGIQPPTRPSTMKPGDGTGTAYALSKIYIGLTTRTGAQSNDAWKDYGYDIDGQNTTTDFSHHCKPNSSASAKDVFPDGNQGRDNSFGKKLLPIIKSAAGSTDIEGSLNKALTDGTFTVIMDLSDLGSGDTYNPVKAYLLGGKGGTPMGAPTTWQLVPELLNGAMPGDDGAASASKAKVTFLNSYVTGNTWVSGDKGTVDLSLSVAGFALDLKIASAVVTMDLAADHKSATNGTIAGVLDTEEFITELKKVVGAFSPSLCEGQAVESILNQIRQASDIMKDGSQDASQTCNGISIGIGFDAVGTTLGTVGDAAMPQSDPCMTTASSSSASGSSSSSSSGTGGG